MSETEQLMPDMDLLADYEHPETPDRTHTPQLERWAYNQMPKSGWRDLKLYRFDDSDLFQWWGKRGKDSAARDWSPFEDSATDVFLIKPRASPAPAASRGMPVRYARSQGSTLAEMQGFIQQHPLHSMGDAVLCWVNEGDLYGGSAKRIAALPDAPVPAKDGEGEG